MTSLLMKLIVLPAAMLGLTYLFPGLDFASVYEPLGLGVILALFGVGMEYMITIKSTLWLSVGADFILFLMLIISANMFREIDVTFTAAVIAALVLSAIESFIHLYLIRSGKTTRTVS
ncbi:MAG TPA: hypothetical protein VFK44_14455 [Bacillales bacterium]|nr:hypothetical protein [Bacillales bacterium]